jgi:hypothetical protein
MAEDDDAALVRLKKLTAQLDAAQAAAKRAAQEFADAKVTAASARQAVHDTSRRTPRAGKKR